VLVVRTPRQHSADGIVSIELRNGAWTITTLVRDATGATTFAWFETRRYYGYRRRDAIQRHKAALATERLVEVDE
jgi:hypothetical protein